MPPLKTLISENKGFLLCLAAMLFARIAIVDEYIVPSSSMYPTLVIGDRVIANRLAYDIRLPLSDIILKRLNDPQRGDIVTFSSPADRVRLIKRLIGVPGDVVEIRNEVLYLNGKAAEYQPVAVSDKVQLAPKVNDPDGKQVTLSETLGELKHNVIVVQPNRYWQSNYGPVIVPPDHYFMMGDNRDNSADSRFIGMVGRELITGRVQHLFFSLDADHYYLPRWSRFGASVVTD